MSYRDESLQDRWALILGASSGFGGATALELARCGMHIFGVHLDRRETMPKVKGIMGQIRDLGREAVYFNVNAADAEKRRETLDAIQEKLESQPEGQQTVRVLLHSLAFGTLKPYVAASPQDQITQPQMEMTLDVMAHSLVYWAQDLVARRLLGPGSRVFAMTSAGSHRILPAYGAVSAAKAALESHIRQLAFELATTGITVNGIRAGVTDTPALRRIPGHEDMMAAASGGNPSGRMTTPPDVAAAIAVLASARTHWITANVIGVDGGEDIAGF